MHSSALTMTQDEFKMLSDAMVELLEDKLVLLGMSDARQASDRIKEVLASFSLSGISGGSGFGKLLSKNMSEQTAFFRNTTK